MSGLVRAEDAFPTRGPSGEWRRYFRGDTHGTRDNWNNKGVAAPAKPADGKQEPKRDLKVDATRIPDQQQVAEIKKLASSWRVDEKLPGKPLVFVEFAGSPRPYMKYAPLLTALPQLEEFSAC
jgi:hypothetical protein